MTLGRVVCATLLTASIGACSTVGPSALSDEPSPGSYHLISDPVAAPFVLTVRLGKTGGLARVGDTFEAGQVVVIDRSTLAGDYWINVNGQDCEGRFSVTALTETDLRLFLLGTSCRVSVVGSHPLGEVQHSDTPGSLLARVPVGGVLEIRPTSPELQGPVRVAKPEEQGSIEVDALAPGEYEISLLVNSVVVKSRTVRLSPGGEEFVDFAQVLPT